MLEMKSIVKDFPGLRALDHVDFECITGEVHCVLGENGAGKSTLMKILAGVYQPDEGEILIDGQKVVINSVLRARELGIGIVFQELSLVPSLSIIENIFAGIYLKNRGFINWHEMKKKAENVLNDVGLEIDPRCLSEELSIAEQQLVEICKVLVWGARFIILDEPTAALSTKEVSRLFDIVQKLKKQGKTIIFISHRLREILEIADRITVLKDGKKIGTITSKEATEDILIRMMIGRQLSDLFPPRLEKKKQDTIFEVKGLSVDNKVINASFSIERGKILGIGGLEGHGQRELLRAIFGLEKKRKGKIFLNGKEIQIKSPLDAKRFGIVLIPEDRQKEGLFSIRSVRENIAISTLEDRQFLGIINQKVENQIVQEVVNKLSIKISTSEQIASSLSGGNAQKVVIAKWLIANPKVFLLLEPTRGVDVATRRQIYYLLRQLSDNGTAIILYSTDMVELIGLCEQILVMYDGKIVELLEGENINEESIMRAAIGKKNDNSFARK